jgi:HEAT repeat protein
MKTILFFVIPAAVLASAADDCFARRGDRSAEAIEAMTRAMDNMELRSCAVENLRIAGAVDALRGGLASKSPETRAAAARVLGTFQRNDLIEELSAAAWDENLLVASNGFAALANYEDPAVTPSLERLARRGGMIADMALERLMKIAPGTAIAVAREMVHSTQVPDRLYALRVMGELGDRSDLPVLKQIAGENQETLESRNRGFGFMPAINLSRAAQVAMENIQSPAHVGNRHGG